MKYLAALITVAVVIICIYVARKRCDILPPQILGTDIEGFRGGRGGGRGGGRHGGWGGGGRHFGGWGGWRGWGWDRPIGVYTAWPYNLYGYPYQYDYVYPRVEPNCILSNAASDCSPSHPVKVGQDTTGDGIKDSWKCCRQY